MKARVTFLNNKEEKKSMNEQRGRESVKDVYNINNPSETDFNVSTESELSLATVFQVAFQ